jgi:hypothetical protein
MKIPSRSIAGLIAGPALLLSVPAHAIVGGGAPSTEGVARSVVTIVGSRGNFCTGALIAPKLVLSAAHCVQPGADYKIVEYGADRQPSLQDVKAVAIHPGFNMQAMSGHRATADVALLQLAAAPKGAATARAAAPSASQVWSQPASPARCRSGLSIPSGRARVRGLAPAREIPVHLFSRTSKAAP